MGSVTKRRKRVVAWGSVSVGVVLLWFGGVMAAVSRAGAANPGARGDAAVVLGAAVWGEEPSPVFAARIDHAIDLYKRGQVRFIVLTGGRGDPGELSEGEAAWQYANSRGVPLSAMLVDPRSTSTRENLLEAQRLMRGAGLSSAVVVSDPTHLLRARMHAERIGLPAECSPTPTTRYRGFWAKFGQLRRESWYVTRLLFTGGNSA
jgi:uncharacterized SAM-binding protein YcdF (DUF218 family)